MLNAYFFYIVSRWLYVHHVPFLPKLITLVIFLIYNSKIPYQASIGKGTRFGYGGMGVIIHKNAVIGTDCSIGAQVTIGGGNSRYPGVPTIGNNVRISKGAIVFGGFNVGDNVVIGANAVVNKPVPDNAIVAGVPAKVIRIKESD